MLLIFAGAAQSVYSNIGEENVIIGGAYVEHLNLYPPEATVPQWKVSKGLASLFQS